MEVRHTYIDTGATAGIIFDDGTGPYKRVIHEFRSPVVFAVCAADRSAFETQMGISTGPQLQGELFEVRHASTAARVGTVFIDQASGRQATGGGVSVELSYACDQGNQGVEPARQNLSLAHSALDTRAIDGASPGTIQREYIGPIQRRLANAGRLHMQAQGCSEISYDSFAALVQSGTAAKLHYDMGDPGLMIWAP